MYEAQAYQKAPIEMAMAAQDNDDITRTWVKFAEAVAEYIAPILTAQGFACTKTSLYIVRFESTEVVMAISHDPFSYEIEVAFSRKTHPSQRYTLRDMLDAVLGSNHKDQDFYQASEPDRIVRCLKAIAELLRKYAQIALAGEPAAYKRMAEVAQLRNEAFTKQLIQEPIRKAAEKAWRHHDYGKVREMYRSIETDLTPAEQKKLKYAQDHRSAENGGCHA